MENLQVFKYENNDVRTVEMNGIVKEETKDVDYVTIKYSDEDYSYKADCYDRTTYDNGSFVDRYTSTVYYLTDEMMRDLGTGGSK